MKVKETIPQSVRAVLWSYDLSKIDLVMHKKLIVVQVLNFGSKEATDWLFKTYPKDEIIKIATLISLDQWDKKSLALWSLYLGINPVSRAERIIHAR